MHGLSSDVDVFRVAEGEDGPGDVLARAHGTGAIGLAQVGVGLASPTLGFDQAWNDGVRADAAEPLLSERPRETDQSALGGDDVGGSRRGR